MSLTRPRRIRRRLAAAGVAVALAGTLAGCGGDQGSSGLPQDSSRPVVGTADRPVTEATIVSKGISFDKGRVIVPVGEPVTFRYENEDTGVPHNFHVTGHGVDSKTAVAPGPVTQTLTVTFPQAGDYDFTCDVHASMMGTITAV